jgi:hypothetical protein
MKHTNILRVTFHVTYFKELGTHSYSCHLQSNVRYGLNSKSKHSESEVLQNICFLQVIRLIFCWYVLCPPPHTCYKNYETKQDIYFRFVVLKVMSMKITVFWDVITFLTDSFPRLPPFLSRWKYIFLNFS